ncbi:MAG: hypothetical protein SFH39_02880 [Candidatus Magnetobacterium sp. LHC-1]|uniref:Uncharacterized protein n=1 Tax=Candidatus Magnetobacterium casense TaxID=1455061 RepID=A0A088FCC8_9BACT|nr:hypothetical protein [Candidatus Magnetobacterium casensis]AIM41292.1 hypothetical protein Mcas_0697 [Candidatus Magnetobacterium casensis]
MDEITAEVSREELISLSINLIQKTRRLITNTVTNLLVVHLSS